MIQSNVFQEFKSFEKTLKEFHFSVKSKFVVYLYAYYYEKLVSKLEFAYFGVIWPQFPLFWLFFHHFDEVML